MKRPLCVIGFSYALAMWLAFLCDNSRNLYISAAIFVTGILVLVLPRKRLVICAALLSAAAAFAANALYQNSEVLPYENLYGREVLIKGTVDSVSANGRSCSYVVDADFPGMNLACVVSIRDFGEPRAAEGEIILCNMTAKPADFKSARVKLYGDLSSEIVIREPSSASEKIAVLKHGIRKRFEANLYSNLKRENADIVGAMVMKLGRGADPEVRDAMNRSGISHLLSISGLHFSIITAYVLGALRKTMLPRRVPEIATLLASAAFVMLTGFSPSIIRAFIMFSIVTIGQIFDRRGDGLNSLVIALLLISAIWPEWVMSVGTWLSFLSTMGIIVASRPMSEFLRSNIKLKRQGRLYGFVNALIVGVSISVSAYLFTFPVMVVNYGWISLAAPVTNLLIAPFVTPIILGGVLCCAIPGGSVPARVVSTVTDFCSSVVVEISRVMGSLPFSVFPLSEVWHVIWIAASIAIAVIIYRRGKTRELAFTGITLIALIFAAGYLSDVIPARSKVELVALENCASQILIRQKDAVILGTPGKYDAAVLLNYLDFRGIKNISMVIASDIGENIGSGLLRLGLAYDINAIIGPDDPYILDQTARALKNVPVYSSGYARTQVLDCAVMTVDKLTGIMTISIGDGNHARRIKRPLRLREITAPGDDIWIFPGGKMILPENAYPVFSPLGEKIFGEVRLVFNITGLS